MRSSDNTSDPTLLATVCLDGEPLAAESPDSLSSEVGAILASDALAKALSQVKNELLELQRSSKIRSELDVARFVSRAEEDHGMLLADELVQSPELRKIMAELFEV